jgi:hypothetical protein
LVGLSGDPQAAAELSGRLADKCADITGESHLTTLETRRAAARWTGAAGDHASAARRYEALLADLAEVLGDNHWLNQQCRIELAELTEIPDHRAAANQRTAFGPRGSPARGRGRRDREAVTLPGSSLKVARRLRPRAGQPLQVGAWLEHGEDRGEP